MPLFIEQNIECLAIAVVIIGIICYCDACRLMVYWWTFRPLLPGSRAIKITILQKNGASREGQAREPTYSINYKRCGRLMYIPWVAVMLSLILLVCVNLWPTNHPLTLDILLVAMLITQTATICNIRKIIRRLKRPKYIPSGFEIVYQMVLLDWLGQLIPMLSWGKPLGFFSSPTIVRWTIKQIKKDVADGQHTCTDLTPGEGTIRILPPGTIMESEMESIASLDRFDRPS